MRRKSPTTSASDLPERLRYLQPFRRRFASSAPEELNEDSGAQPLITLLAKRIRGLSITKAIHVLEHDSATLEQWLSSRGDQSDPLHFAFGFLVTATPDDIVHLIEEEAEKAHEPKLCLHMDLPPGSKLRRVPGATESTKLVVLKGLWLAIDALSKEAVDNSFDATLGSACGSRASSIPQVQFGPVTGRKLVTKQEDLQTPLKQISYALTVPGGHVIAFISPVGKKVDELNWDETPFEACFHTLRVETKPPPERDRK